MTPCALDRSLVASLPTPLAHHLQELLDEEEPRSADEISEFLTVLLEYVAAVALADYLACETAEAQPSLDGWLVTALSSGRVGLGIWLRWTQLAVKSTPDPALGFLRDYVEANDLDDPNSDLNWLLGFRNDVMHGGFVAPLPKIKQAKKRLEALLASLQPLFALNPMGCLDSQESWLNLAGLQPHPCGAPEDLSEPVEGGAVVLCGEGASPRLRLDPLCSFHEEGLALQHDWKQHHESLFERTRLAAFFTRYQRERMGIIPDDGWRQACAAERPPGGYRRRPEREADLQRLAEEPGLQLRLVGAPGSGRSSLTHHWIEHYQGPVAVYPVLANSVTCDPEVLRRWVAQSLSRLLLEEDAPAAALKAEPRKKDLQVQDQWQQRLTTALAGCQHRPVLVIDDAEDLGSGIYAQQSKSGCLRLARQMKVSVLMIHRPSGRPPAQGDGVIELGCWSVDELGVWGDEPDVLWQKTGGYTAWLAAPDRTQAWLASERDARCRDPLTAHCFHALSDSSLTALEIADRIDLAGHRAFSPEVELQLRSQLDWLETEKVTEAGKDVLRYRLHPAMERVLEAQR